jgi:hypothetical protein
VAKGSSAHNLLVTALEDANIAWSDITPVYLAPADAASAFARGSIDAWSIWDPFYAIAELKQNARALPIDLKKTAQNSFFLANRDFLASHADIVSAINEEIAGPRHGPARIAMKRPHCFLRRAESRSPRRGDLLIGPNSPSRRSTRRSSPSSKRSPTASSGWD